MGQDHFGQAMSGVLTHPGLGQGFATGALNLFNPERYPLVNGASRGPFEKSSNPLLLTG